MLSRLVPYVLLSHDGCCFGVFTVSGDDASCFCDSNCVGSLYGYDHLYQPLYHGSVVHHCPTEPLQWTLLKTIIISGSIVFLVILLAYWLTLSLCSSSLS